MSDKNHRLLGSQFLIEPMAQPRDYSGVKSLERFINMN